MFIDEVKLTLMAGAGGDGCMAFRREKYIPMGGPYGGNGGKGGNIIFKADEGLRTLLDLKYQKKIKGNSGNPGSGKNKNGSQGEDKIIKIPIGSVIKDLDNDYILADLTIHNQEVVLAVGGRGGRGNVSLATRSNPCPKVCERGEEGEVRHIGVELKMLADVGLVGLPSVGKSTILSMVSNANPKIAAYHFTTLTPNLGVVQVDNNTFVIADLPGLIAGASTGAGLGIKFLKHVERTKLIAHVLDMSDENVIDNYQTINKELAEFSQKLALKKQIIIANKMDLPKSITNLQKFRTVYPDLIIFEISAINNKGLDIVMKELQKLVVSIKDEPLIAEDKIESHVLYKFQAEKPFSITKDNRTWVIKGEKVEKLLKMTNFNTSEAMYRFATKLRKMGIDEKLEELGIVEGDTVRILDYEFTWER